MDPLAGHWDYQHFDGGLHPTAAGDTWIAGKVADILRANGVLPAAAGGRTPMICDAAAGVGGLQRRCRGDHCDGDSAKRC